MVDQPLKSDQRALKRPSVFGCSLTHIVHQPRCLRALQSALVSVVPSSQLHYFVHPVARGQGFQLRYFPKCIIVYDSLASCKAGAIACFVTEVDLVAERSYGSEYAKRLGPSGM